jgi:5-formyltetrahydrofolate cyclo-ligase
MEKQTIRNEMLRKRKTMMAAQVRSAGEMILERLIRTSYYQNSACIFVYMSFENEIDTGNFLSQAIRDKKTICIPDRTEPDGMRAVVFGGNPGDLCECWPGILSVTKDKCIEVDPNLIDLCLVPGLAFGKDMNRIGFGAGYYDSFLGKVRTDCVKIGLAYSFQILESITASREHDRKMDLVITEQGIVK